MQRPRRISFDVRDHIVAISFAIAITILAVIAQMLVDGRKQAWEGATQETENVRRAIEGDVSSRLTLYGSLLDSAAAVLGGANSIAMSPDEIARLVESMVRDYEVAGNIVILDENGYSRADAARRSKSSDNFADRSYFSVHKNRSDVGLFISPPFQSRIRGGEWSIGLSRRINDSRGEFAGVAVAALRLDHFRSLFSRIKLGTGGTLALIGGDGIVVMRQPSADGFGDVGRDVSAGAAFKQISTGEDRSFIVTSSLDGVERLVSSGPVTGFSLYVTVAASTQTVLQDWWHQTLVIGGLTLPMCSAIVLLAMLLQRRLNELVLAHDALSVLASTDALTGLPNRREFDLVVHREWQRAMRSGHWLSLLIIDADNFKQVNDRMGHLEGDKVLRKLAHLIRGNLERGGDFAARYGGEEFAAVLSETDATGAETVAEKIRSAVATWDAEEKRHGRVGVTVSIGMASLQPTQATRVDQLLAAADAALYAAKRRGKNRAEAAQMDLKTDGVVVSFPSRSSVV
jgi:diguanylate cyclase (GGDEF)-like protein